MKIKIRENQSEAIEGISREYPYAFHHVNIRETTVPWHWHEELELEYIAEGRVKVTTAGKHFFFGKGEGFFTNTNVLSAMEDAGGENPCVLESHLFHPVFLSGHFKSIFDTKYLEPVLQDKRIEIIPLRGANTGQKEILKKLRKLALLQAEKDTEFQTRNLLSEIWLLLSEEIRGMEFDEPKINPASRSRIQEMLSFIHENYERKITLEEMAASASVSKRECIRCFQECIHKTPFEYLTDYRVERAEKLLRTTGQTVTEIALAAGFSNGAYFGKVFRNYTGKTPGQFRKENREETVPAN